MKTYVIPLIAAASLLAGCNRSIQSVSEQFNALPPEVQKSARAQAPDAEISGVSKTTQNGADAYDITFDDHGTSHQMVVAPDGRVLSTDMPAKPAGTIQKLLTPTGAVGTQFSALPEKVQATIQSKSPNAEIANITKHDENGRVIYQVEFRDQGKNPTIQIAEDGTLVQDLQK